MNQNSIKQTVPSPASPYPQTQNSCQAGTPVRSVAGDWFNGINRTTSAAPSVTVSVTVYSKEGKPLMLTENDLKTSGGEGHIYRLPLPGKEHVLIKLYKADSLYDSRKRDLIFNRLRDMLEMKEIAAQGHLAWPRAGIFDADKNLVGFAMNKCLGHSFLAISGGLASVRRHFPGWDRSHLARTALDFVNKVKFLADHNVYINDFNPANFLVNENCEVSFIDCDSYQIPGRPSGAHITRVYFSSHVAPELLENKTLLNGRRNIHHVEFGVAILVFQLLMMGLHPYNYYDPQRQSACASPEENLKAGRCPLGIGANCLFPKGPWYNLWSWLTGDLKGAFIQTFRDGHREPEKRASLSQMKAALEKLLYEMKTRNNAMRTSLSPDHKKPSLYKQMSSQSHTSNSSDAARAWQHESLTSMRSLAHKGKSAFSNQNSSPDLPYTGLF